MHNSDIIFVENLKKTFKGKIALDNISFSLKKGNTLGLLGPNGSGKTTTIGILLGLIKETEGKIVINDINLNSNKRNEVLNIINFASPYTELPKRLTVKENLVIYARLYGIKNIKDRVNELIENFDLGNLQNFKTGTLSSGQKTRVALAKSMINKPKLLFLDEPTASLDPIISEYLRNFILDYKENNEISILFSSHNMQEVQGLCDQIIFLKDGKIVEIGNIEEILDKYKKKALEDVYFKIYGNVK